MKRFTSHVWLLQHRPLQTNRVQYRAIHGRAVDPRKNPRVFVIIPLFRSFLELLNFPPICYKLDKSTLFFASS